MRRFILAMAMAAGALAIVVAAGPAYAGSNANGSISVTPSTVPAGGTVRISGSVRTDLCPAADDAIPTSTDALFPPDGFGPTTPRDAGGRFAVSYRVPTTTPAGEYVIGLRCGGGNVGVSATLKVTNDPVGAPATGAGGTAHASPNAWVAFGSACLALAGILVVFGRRRAARAS